MLELRLTTFGYLTAKGPLHITGPVSLDVLPGSLVGLVGPSGIGKSTILRTVAALVPPLSGEVSVGTGAGGRRDCWFEPQAPVFLPFRDVLQNALASRELDRALNRDDLQVAVDLVSRIGLHDAGAGDPHRLSGGMRRRLALAQGLLAERRLLLLDEPLAELDLGTRRIAEQLLWELGPADARTVLFASHDIDSVVAVADMVVILQAPLPARALQVAVAERFPPSARGPDARRSDAAFPAVVAEVQRMVWEQRDA